ncbi:hypothetical protein [Novosphingobium sp. ERN07]|uniref:DUF3617 domain-containing protein n=1 Tax=Novosphingobium sp. ERN07 TaxID=2726187 RepID=UPI001F1033F3|nr:hypothetical protein [Novosphingobium sp. ERN07]
MIVRTVMRRFRMQVWAMFKAFPLYRHFGRGAVLVATAACGFAATSGVAQGPSLAMLDRLESGLWEVRARDEADTVQICIDNGRKLIQIRHQRETCRRFIVDDTPGLVTVHYTCPANGYGHTRVRFENARLAHLETQGIDNGLPFNFVAEARRIGACR